MRPVKDKRGSLRRRLIVVLAVAAIVIIVLIGLDTCGRKNPELEAELAALRALGRPVEIADFGQPPIPDDENAAIVYAQAFELFTAYPFDEGISPADFATDWKETPSDEELTGLREHVLENREPLRIIEEGTRFPSCYFDAEWENGYDALLPHLGYMREALAALLARARFSAMDGTPANVVADVRTALRFSGSAHRQPALVSELVAWVLEALCTQSIQQLCDNSELDAAMLEALEADLAAIRDRETAAYTMATERVLTLYTIGRWRRGELSLYSLSGEPSKGISLLERFVRLRIDFNEEELACVRYYKRVQELLARPYYESKEDLDALEQELLDMADERKLIIFGMLAPAFGKVAAEQAKRGARIDITRMGLAAHAYRVQNGHWPAKPPIVFVDPFDGKQLRYRVDGQNVRIWSVGEDLTDDGGAEIDPASGDPKGDILWKLRIPETR